MNINFENRNNVWVIVCVWQPLLGISNHLPLSPALPSHPSHLVNMYSVWRPQLLCEIPFLTRRGFHGAGTSLVSLSTKGLRTLAKGVQSREQTDEGRVPSDGLWQVQQGGRGCSAWLGFPMASSQASCVSAAAVSQLWARVLISVSSLHSGHIHHEAIPTLTRWPFVEGFTHMCHCVTWDSCSWLTRVSVKQERLPSQCQKEHPGPLPASIADYYRKWDGVQRTKSYLAHGSECGGAGEKAAMSLLVGILQGSIMTQDVTP